MVRPVGTSWETVSLCNLSKSWIILSIRSNASPHPHLSMRDPLPFLATYYLPLYFRLQFVIKTLNFRLQFIIKTLYFRLQRFISKGTNRCEEKRTRLNWSFSPVCNAACFHGTAAFRKRGKGMKNAFLASCSICKFANILFIAVTAGRIAREMYT